MQLNKLNIQGKKIAQFLTFSMFVCLLTLVACQKENIISNVETPATEALVEDANQPSICEHYYDTHASTYHSASAPTANNRAIVPFTIDSTFTVSETISASAEKSRLSVQFQSYENTPVGFYLAAGASVTLNVTKTAGTRYPKLVIGTYSRNYSTADPYWNSSSNILQVQLVEGTNVIQNTSGTGGLLYLN
jgi:hypothetical protein